MKIYLKSVRNGIDAEATFDLSSKACRVLAGSRISNRVSQSETFRSRKTVEKLRIEHVRDGILINDVEFKSPSTAASFVTGSSTNGFTAWKDENGKQIGKLINGGV